MDQANGSSGGPVQVFQASLTVTVLGYTSFSGSGALIGGKRTIVMGAYFVGDTGRDKQDIATFDSYRAVVKVEGCNTLDGTPDFVKVMCMATPHKPWRYGL